jgi:hypothetical protein
VKRKRKDPDGSEVPPVNWKGQPLRGWAEASAAERHYFRDWLSAYMDAGGGEGDPEATLMWILFTSPAAREAEPEDMDARHAWMNRKALETRAALSKAESR